MHDGYQGNAMAEIALALAMAFFSIMVLTMISMGAGIMTDAPASAANVDGITVAPSVPATDQTPAAARVGDDVLVIHYAGRFFTKDLTQADPNAFRGDGRVVLAIDPSLSMERVIAIRKQIPARNLIVSTLDGRWLETLEGRKP